MEVIKMKDFENISQRILYGYNFAFSDFFPVKSDIADDEAQKELHSLMQKIIDELFKDPSLLNLPLSKDESYEWYVCNNQKPELNAVYLSVNKKLYEFYKFFYITSFYGDIRENNLAINKNNLKAYKSSYKDVYKNLLNSIGFEVMNNKDEVIIRYSNNLLSALKLLVMAPTNRKALLKHSNDLNPIFEFIRCSFDGNYDYILERIDKLYSHEGLLLNLKKQCLENGYNQILYLDFGQTNFSFNVFYQKNVGGFKVGYNPRKYQQFYFATLNGIGEKAMVEDFDNLSIDMQRHFIEICRPCNNCLGCTKSGKFKPFTVIVNFNNCEHKLCPQFPQHEWEMFTQDRINTLFEYHGLQDKYTK